MRLPGRLHITWQDDNTLKIETDAGTQTRLLPLRLSRRLAARAELAGAIDRPVGTPPARRGAATRRQPEGA